MRKFSALALRETLLTLPNVTLVQDFFFRFEHEFFSLLSDAISYQESE